MNLVIVTVLALLVCSCRNNNEQRGKYFSYQLIHEDRFYTKLAIIYGDDNTSNYVMFDDEEDYYDDNIYEWHMALLIARGLCANSCIEKGDFNTLKCVHCLPDCLDKYGIMDEKTRNIILKTYYDYQDVKIYEPERGYGWRKYPVRGGFGEEVTLFRIEEGKYENVPGGTLGIKFPFF